MSESRCPLCSGQGAADMSLREFLAFRIRWLRDQRGLNQHELAEQSGVGRSMIANIEVGRTVGSVDTLVKIAAALNVPVGDLLPTPTDNKEAAE